MKIVVRELAAKDKKSWAKCFTVLQSIEASIESDRLQPSAALENDYWDYLHNQCAQKCGRVFVAMADTEVCGFVAGWIEEDAANLITTLHKFIFDKIIYLKPIRLLLLSMGCSSCEMRNLISCNSCSCAAKPLARRLSISCRRFFKSLCS